MRFGTPQCGVAVELPAPARRSGWSRVSSDTLRNVWTVDAEAQRDVFFFSSQEIAQWTSLFGENQAVQTLPALTSPITSIEAGDRVIAIVHGDANDQASWTWVVTHLGTILLIDAAARSVVSSHRIGAVITAVCRMGPADLIVATRGPTTSNYSEVISLHYTHDNTSKPPTAKGKALFRLGDQVECLCIAAAKSAQDAANSSILSNGWDTNAGRHLLFSITEHGNIDVWDLAAACDATSEFHDLHYDTEDLGGPTCAAVVGSALWIGTSFGPVVVCPVAGAGSFEVLQHHKAKVTSIFPMTLGSRVWSCCSDGVVAVWSVARKKPCGQFDIQATPMLSLHNTQPQLLTSVWGVDARHRATCWEVREDFVDALHVIEDGTLSVKSRGSASPARRNTDTREAWVGFVGSLCDVLTGRAKECSFPPMLLDEHDAPEEARYLPDALVSLSECREMICGSFRELEWQSVSLSEDVKYLAKRAKDHRRAYSRASQLAEKLSSLTPMFPLPSGVDDPVERLVIAAECVLEEVMDQGVLRDPRQSRNVSCDTPPPDLDRSGIPEAQSLSEHIFDTQMRSLEARLEDEKKTNDAMRHRMKDLEDENDRLLSEASSAREQADRFSSDAERWRKAHVTSKKRLQSVQEQHDAEKMALAQELDTARLELAAARSASQAVPVEDKRKRAPLEAFKADTNKVVTELARLLQNSCEEQRSMRAASLEVLDELAETKSSFLEMEEAGKRMIQGFESERVRAVDDLTALQRQISSKSLNIEAVQRRLQSIVAAIGGGGPQAHDAPATPPRGPLRVAF
jgi:hypothetical protein